MRPQEMPRDPGYHGRSCLPRFRLWSGFYRINRLGTRFGCGRGGGQSAIQRGDFWSLLVQGDFPGTVDFDQGNQFQIFDEGFVGGVVGEHEDVDVTTIFLTDTEEADS